MHSVKWPNQTSNRSETECPNIITHEQQIICLPGGAQRKNGANWGKAKPQILHTLQQHACCNRDTFIHAQGLLNSEVTSKNCQESIAIKCHPVALNRAFRCFSYIRLLEISRRFREFNILGVFFQAVSTNFQVPWLPAVLSTSRGSRADCLCEKLFYCGTQNEKLWDLLWWCMSETRHSWNPQITHMQAGRAA